MPPTPTPSALPSWATGLHVERLSPANSPVHSAVHSPSAAELPSLVFLHGLAGSTASWTEAFRGLSAQREVWLVDLLGFGQSPKPRLDYSLQEHLTALRASLAANGVQKPVLVGHSMGSLLALAWAAEHPQELSGLFLMALPWFNSQQEAIERIGSQSWFNRWMALKTPLARWSCWLMCRLRPQLLPWMPRLLPEVAAQAARDVLQHTWWSYSGSLEHVVLGSAPADWLARVAVPVMMVQGERDISAAPEPVAQGLARVQAGLKEQAQMPAYGPHAALGMTILPGAGHHMIFSHTEQLVGLLQDFLRRLPCPTSNNS